MAPLTLFFCLSCSLLLLGTPLGEKDPQTLLVQFLAKTPDTLFPPLCGHCGTENLVGYRGMPPRGQNWGNSLEGRVGKI